MSFPVCKTTYRWPTKVEVIARREGGLFYVRPVKGKVIRVANPRELIVLTGNLDINQLPIMTYSEAVKLSRIKLS